MKKIRLKDAVSAAAGLTDDQAAVYAALSRTGPATIAAAARASGLYRTDVYAALPGLKKLGLIAEKRVGKRVLRAASPASVLQALAERRLSMLPKTLRDLRKNRPETELPDGVRFLSGKRGLAAVLEDLISTLKNGDAFYRVSSRKADTDVEQYMPRDYRAARDRKKLEQFVITNASLRAKPFKKRLECLSKAVPKDEDPFEYDVAQLIYGDKIAFVDYAKETALVIESPSLARFQERLFRLLFQRL